jgi:hypothetical protein
MTSLTQPGHPVRSVLRSTGVLGASVTLTVVVLVVLSSVVGTWA